MGLVSLVIIHNERAKKRTDGWKLYIGKLREPKDVRVTKDGIAFSLDYPSN